MIVTLQLGGIGIGTVAIGVGALLGVLVLGGTALYGSTQGWFDRDPYETAADALAEIRGDADALALLPYDDGTFFLKPANFDKELIGGQGGYETPDGDKIVLDGGGQPVKSLFGVDMLLACDPTEHAGAVSAIKALMAHKKHIGEYIKVDKNGSVIEIGEGLELADESDLDAADIGPQGSVIQDGVDGLETDGGVAADVPPEKAISRVEAELEEEGEITKIYDLAPPAAAAVDENGELVIEEASHIAVDQSKAADLMPTTTSTTELNTALDKARMEEYDEGKYLKYTLYGAIGGFLIAILGGGAITAINSFL